MTCNEFQERVVDLLDATPKPADWGDRALRDHVGVCGACAALYRELQETLAALEPAVRLEASPLFKERLMNEIDNLPPAVTAKRNPLLRLWKPVFAAAAATLLIVFLVLHSRPVTPAVAFADVVRNLAVFRPYSHTAEGKVGKKKPQLFAHHFIMSPAIRRSEFPDGRVIIFDLATGDQLHLWPDHKKATKHCYPNLPPASHPSIYEIVDTVGRINGKPEFLGTKRMEGKKCSVFHASDGTNNDYTIWVDNQNQLPVRIEVIHLQTGNTVIESHFNFDIEIDPARFSLEPPTDYDFSGTVTHEDKIGQDNDSRPFRPYSNLDEQIGKDGERKVAIRRYTLSSTIRRDEMSDGRVFIHDLSAGTELELWPHKRLAIKHVYRKYDPRGRVNVSLDDMCANLTSIGWGPKNIGTKIIDGKDCTGFHATDFVNNDITVWVDSQTNLPVRAEINQIKQKRTLIESDFQVDIDTDPARFSLEPPPDYECKVVEQDFK